MKVKPYAVELDDDQRREIARYWDAVNDEPWGDETDEDYDEKVVRLAGWDECWQYIDNLLTGYLTDDQLKEAADMAEGAM